MQIAQLKEMQTQSKTISRNDTKSPNPAFL